MFIFFTILSALTLLLVPLGGYRLHKIVFEKNLIPSKNPYRILLAIVLTLIIAGGLYGIYYIGNDAVTKAYDSGYSNGVSDCEDTITEGIAKGKKPSGQLVYYTESGTVIHNKVDCQYLKNSSKVLNAPISSKSDWKKCSKCW